MFFFVVVKNMHYRIENMPQFLLANWDEPILQCASFSAFRCSLIWDW